MGLDFHGLAVIEPDSGAIRFEGYARSRSGTDTLVVCRVMRQTLVSLAHERDPAPSALMQAFERNAASIQAAATAKFERGDTAPMVTVRDLLLKRA